MWIRYIHQLCTFVHFPSPLNQKIFLFIWKTYLITPLPTPPPPPTWEPDIQTNTCNIWHTSHRLAVAKFVHGSEKCKHHNIPNSLEKMEALSKNFDSDWVRVSSSSSLSSFSFNYFNLPFQDLRIQVLQLDWGFSLYSFQLWTSVSTLSSLGVSSVVCICIFV